MSSSVAHFDVAGPDTGRLHRFYGRVFGWQVDEQGPGYALVRTPEGSADGAIVEADDASLTVGVAVPDLEAALATAQELGGEVVMPATDNGWVVKGQIADPAGNLITLIQA
jgi:predicted enzyme related to lactoylglutathione lyase